MQAVSVGPWVLSVSVLAIALGLAVANAAASFMRKRKHGDAGPALWWLLATALVAARVAFVWRWWAGYRAASWWSVLDIRNGGFIAWVAVVVLAVGTLIWMLRRPTIRRTLPLAVTAGLVTWMVVILAAGQLRQAAHPPLPNLVLQDLQGGNVDLASLTGQPMVVNLWATWCPPCRREMPMLVAASHDTPGVRFVFIDQGESASTVKAYLHGERLAPATVLLDAGSELAGRYRAPGYPTTLFLDASGHLQDMRIGPLTQGTLRAHLQHIITPTKVNPSP